jgi:hypothetical protein
MKDHDRKYVLTQYYEDLRDSILNRKMTLEPPRGLTLFLRQGMAGWIEAWSRPMLSDQALIISPQPAKIGSISAGPLSSEAATILVNMVLAAARRNNL